MLDSFIRSFGSFAILMVKITVLLGLTDLVLMPFLVSISAQAMLVNWFLVFRVVLGCVIFVTCLAIIWSSVTRKQHEINALQKG